MAFSCVMWLKSECDGCGLCEKDHDAEDDEDYDPFWDDEEDE